MCFMRWLFLFEVSSLSAGILRVFPSQLHKCTWNELERLILTWKNNFDYIHKERPEVAFDRD